jgi:hypothetical protein
MGMKILFAYDGSDGVDTGIDGLLRAGLPTQGVEALVVSVAEVWLPPPPRDEVIDDTFPFQIPGFGVYNCPETPVMVAPNYQLRLSRRD